MGSGHRDDGNLKPNRANDRQKFMSPGDIHVADLKKMNSMNLPAAGVVQLQGKSRGGHDLSGRSAQLERIHFHGEGANTADPTAVVRIKGKDAAGLQSVGYGPEHLNLSNIVPGSSSLRQGDTNKRRGLFGRRK